VSIYDAAMAFRDQGKSLIVIAGKEYGSGSSRDWAAKGTRLLGVRVVLAENFERIHRSNLIGMGVLPVQFTPGQSRTSLGLTGFEEYELRGLEDGLQPRQRLQVRATSKGDQTIEFEVAACVETPNEVQYYRHGGILHYVLRSLKSETEG
jgi:aconitate hydratase